MALIKKFFCPVNGWNCPYYMFKDGSCSISNPIKECEDVSFFWEDDDDPYIWEDEQGKLYDRQELLEKGFHFVNDEPVLPPYERR